MNSFPLSFVVHDGDFKDPATACSDDRFRQVKEAFNKSKAPFVYTPGDNEWMDCDDAGVAHPMDSIDRLAKLRETFFAHDQSLGVNRMPLERQRQEGSRRTPDGRRRAWSSPPSTPPGPSDNLDYVGPNPQEAGARRVANLAWLRETFERAKATNAPAVMIIWQADPWQPKFRRTWDYLDGRPRPGGLGAQVADARVRQARRPRPR